MKIKITPDILIKEGFKYVNKATNPESVFMCYEKGDVLLRYRAKGLFRINPNNKLENISDELEYLHQLKELSVPETNFDAKEGIAFRDKDIDGDIWCERSFFFTNEDEINDFFVANNNVLLDVYTEENNRVLNNFEVNKTFSGELITCVTFNTEYAGDVKISRMFRGINCSKK